MGIFSDIQKFHGAGERPNENVLERFGAPARSLYTELDPGDLHQKISVRDEQGQLLYWTKSSVFALRGKTDLFDAGGAQVAHLEKKPISLHEEHYITLDDGRQITLSNELFHIFRDAIGQKMLSIHDRYSIDLYQPQYEKTVAAIVISLQKMLIARRSRDNGSN